MTSAADEPRSPFAVPIYRAVWFANTTSNFGAMIQSVAASWTMASMTASPQMIALVQASSTLPIMLFALLAGAVADNLDRRRVMMAAQIFMLILSLLLSASTWAQLLTPWTLLTFTFLIACGTAFKAPAWQASVGEMVPRPVLPSAIAYNAVGFNIARSAGPAVGGLLVATAGSAAAFLANAFSHLGLIGVLARWRTDTPTARLPREPLGSAMAAGIRYVAMSPSIRSVLLRAALFGFGSSAIPAMMPLVARDILRGGPTTYGLLLAAFGCGAVGAALSSSRLRRSLSSEGIVRLAMAVVLIGLVTIATAPLLALILPALMLAGAGWVLALSTFNVSVQFACPRWVAARALSLYQSAVFGGTAIGSWCFGLIAEHHGPTAALMAAAMIQIVGLITGLRHPLTRLEDVDLSPHGWNAPETAVAIEARAGPIEILIEHRIDPADIAAFRSAMIERRRMRRRDGARDWRLLRDLSDPHLWIERYMVANWTEYVRHNERRTRADAANSEMLRTLQIGGEPVIIRRMLEQQPATPTDGAGPRMISTPDMEGNA
ncbi:MFS transporter [Sphingomonas crocodyli]|uniref:MFS transporter n=1 Tax=Sphingomonas crocodyli TaxID=1979270 RepID=A0A437LZX1_9SPHN|nr:MFS transporter [Sphingomonas crocodyli]RVT90952.1 MFS transporter [Sphingomonas crocodyli]